MDLPGLDSLLSPSSGSDIKTDGFTLTTCRTMVNLLDVSFHTGLSYCQTHLKKKKI